MLRKLSTHIPVEIFDELHEEAAKYKTTIAEVMRRKLLEAKNVAPVEAPPSPEVKESENKLEDLPFYPLMTEIILLLREFIFERNAQVLRKVDEQMDKRFGKERPKL